MNNGNYRVVNEVTSTVTTGAKEGTIIIEKPAAEALEKAKGEDILVFKIVFGEEYDDNGQLVSTMTFTIEKTHVDKEYTISGNKSGIETFECPNNTILFWLLWGEE